MRMVHLFFLLGVSIAACDGTAQAPALLVDGKPADPLCFAPYLLGNGQSETIALKGCGDGYITDNEYYSDIDGFVGTGFREESNEEGYGMRPAFIAYRVVGRVGDKLAVTVTGSGGGTGVFSTLFTARHVDDQLILSEFYAGGDRCNGGITEAEVTPEGALRYAFNITPYDFLNLDGAPEPKGIEPYDDLDACAACCMGEALYTDKEFTGVRLPEKYKGHERPAEQVVQLCFDAIMEAQGESEWTRENYAPLRDRIIKECGK